MCITNPSESGHGGRFEPCDAYLELKLHHNEQMAGAYNNAVLQINKLKKERDALRAALDATGVPEHAKCDDLGSPLRIAVKTSKGIMERLNGS